MYPIKQSTAITVPFYVHDTSGNAVTGLTNASFTKRISKNGAAFAAMTVTITEMENGWYSIPLTTTHTNTLGLLTIVFTNAGAQQVNLQWRVEAKLTDDLVDFDPATDAVANVTTVGTCTTNTDMRGTDNALLASNYVDHSAAIADIPTVAEFNARTLLAADYFDATTDAVIVGTNNDKTGYALTQSFPANFASLGISVTGAIDNVDLVDVCTTNTDMRGTDGANTVAPDNASISLILTDTNELQTNQNNWLTATDVNVASINGVAVIGTGISTDLWRA